MFIFPIILLGVLPIVGGLKLLLSSIDSAFVKKFMPKNIADENMVKAKSTMSIGAIIFGSVVLLAGLFMLFFPDEIYKIAVIAWICIMVNIITMSIIVFLLLLFKKK